MKDIKNRRIVCELHKSIPRYCVYVPCERCILGKLYDLWDRPLKNGVYAYKNYVLSQSPAGDYYITNSKTGKWVVHAQCTKRLSRREAKGHILFYLRNKR